MMPRVTRRRWAASIAGFWAISRCSRGSELLAAGPRAADPAQMLPMGQIPAGQRELVAEVIRDAMIRRKGATDSFPCQSPIYQGLIDEPAITLALWQDLGDSPVRLRQVAPGRYEGTDGAGASATWEIVLRTPKLHVFYSNLDYTSPRGAAHLQGRIVLIVRSGYFKEVNGEPYVQHDVEAFVKVDSKGWKALARTVRPILEKVLEDQVQEAGLFISLMGRLVETYPNWACQTALKAQTTAEAKQEFRSTVTQYRRPGASAGRPEVAGATAPQSGSSRRRS